MALALYRKYRPATFAEVVGQEHVTAPLMNAVDGGRINHAYLFSGPRGCGKTSSARILARSLNCEQGPTSTPCGVCGSCIALAPDGPGSLDVMEIDAASHGGVDDARDLRERAFFAPVNSRYKVYIVDEAHMVTTQGFNALLKVVEEPPEFLVFVFATTEPDKVLPTIRSRTHHYPFRLVPPTTLRGLLEKTCDAEGVTVEPTVFPLVVRAGGGSVRDSLSILDQLLAGAGPEGVTYKSAVGLLGVTDDALLDETIDALAAHDAPAVFRAVDRVVEAGHDPRRFATDLLDRLRDLIVLDAVPDAGGNGLLDSPPDRLDLMSQQAQALGSATLSRMADTVHEGLTEMRGTTAPRLLLELVCARMLLPGDRRLGGRDPAAARAPGAPDVDRRRARRAVRSPRRRCARRRPAEHPPGPAPAPAPARAPLPRPPPPPAARAGQRRRAEYVRPSQRSERPTPAAVPRRPPAPPRPRHGRLARDACSRARGSSRPAAAAARPRRRARRPVRRWRRASPTSRCRPSPPTTRTGRTPPSPAAAGAAAARTEAAEQPAARRGPAAGGRRVLAGAARRRADAGRLGQPRAGRGRRADHERRPPGVAGAARRRQAAQAHDRGAAEERPGAPADQRRAHAADVVPGAGPPARRRPEQGRHPRGAQRAARRALAGRRRRRGRGARRRHRRRRRSRPARPPAPPRRPRPTSSWPSGPRRPAATRSPSRSSTRSRPRCRCCAPSWAARSTLPTAQRPRKASTPAVSRAATASAAGRRDIRRASAALRMFPHST